MEQVILGSNQATVSGGSETASFYNPFQAFASKKFSQENSQIIAAKNSSQPVVEQVGEVVNHGINNEGDTPSNQAQSEAPITNQPTSLDSTPAPPIVEVATTGQQLPTENVHPASEMSDESAIKSGDNSPVMDEEQNQQSADTLAPATDSQGEQAPIEHDLVVPFPSDEQMGEALDLTPGSADIQGAVFSQELQQQADEKQQDQDIGGKQDVVGLLSHLTKGQDEQSGEKVSPQICEIDQKTGAWLGEGCQDEPVVEDSQTAPVGETLLPEQNLVEGEVSITEAQTLINKEQDASESEQEMSTYAPTSGKIEIVDTNSNEVSTQVAPAMENMVISESKDGQIAETSLTNTDDERASFDDELPSTKADRPNSAELNSSPLAEGQSEGGVSTEIKPLIDDDKQETFERALMNLADGEQSTEQALERIKQYYAEQLTHENQEGKLLQLLFDLEQVDKNLLNLKKQYQQIDTLQRVWE